MITNVGHRHSCHTDHRGACRSQGSRANHKPSARKGGRQANVLPLFTRYPPVHRVPFTCAVSQPATTTGTPIDLGKRTNVRVLKSAICLVMLGAGIAAVPSQLAGATAPAAAADDSSLVRDMRNGA